MTSNPWYQHTKLLLFYADFLCPLVQGCACVAVNYHRQWIKVISMEFTIICIFVQVGIPSLGLLFWYLKTHFAFLKLRIVAFEWHSVWWCSYTVDANVYSHWTIIYIRTHTTWFLFEDHLSQATLKDLGHQLWLLIYEKENGLGRGKKSDKPFFLSHDLRVSFLFWFKSTFRP